MKTQQRTLVGLVGHPSSGKDTVAAYLVERHGFSHVSAGDLIRVYVREHNLGAATRENLHEVGKRLRTERGADYLVRLALEQDMSPRLVLSGIRTVGEAIALKTQGGLLLAVTAPLALRYERAKERGRVGDEVTFGQFKDIEEKESASDDPNAQNVRAVIALADVTIENTGTPAELFSKIDTVLTPRSHQ